MSCYLGSGYTVNVIVSSVDARPLYASVDHSAGNDLEYAGNDLKSAPPDYTELCQYPVPEYYTISVALVKVGVR